MSQLSLLEEEPTKDLFPPLRYFADYLIEQILKNPNLMPGTPLLISGDWGVGKTSILEYINDELGTSSYVFKAWRYENEPSLLAVLVSNLWNDLGKPMEVHGAIKTIGKACLSLATRVIGQATGFNNITLENIQKDFDTVAGGPIQGISIETDLLNTCFNDIIEKLNFENHLTIFIDDLDRCSPEKAIVMLEQIRQLLFSKSDERLSKVRFVVLMDQVTLAEAVRNKYQRISSYDSNRYLQKVFPLSFQIPKPSESDVSRLVSHTISEINEQLEMEELANLPQLIAILSEPIYANPRLIIRCLNKLRLLIHYEHHQDHKALPITNATISWLAAIERWPLIRQLLWLKDPGFWQKLYQHINMGEPFDDKDASRLLSQPGVRELLGKFAQGEFLTQMDLFADEDKRLQNAGL